MNTEKQRIAIAEACGWKNADHPDVMKLKQGWTMPEKWCMDPNGVLQFNHNRPDYLNDLNAMHEAERVLPQDLRARWMIQLCKITEDAFWSTTRATASQRAEAFLRALGKWKVDK